MLNTQGEKLITGTYIVYRLNDRYTLENRLNKVKESINCDKLHIFLLQNFDIDIVNKIEEALNSEKRLLIDFDTNTVKLVEKKEPTFEEYMSSYMTAQAAQSWKDDQEIPDSVSTYPYWFL